ncbi:MAG TPA: N-acetyl-1-D-myo-inositol-2-amino-2-deoxy-alpha-D-glucopyranoside deacetylase [Jiangellales bacterium]|nr:N-acetyl-1-D-myo-inositol-2-amino-2-deoxy-alpha-D-glucopyranoside deacetylase [Jiangellales bacterium]
MQDRRLLLVHAHPDDETITCGATMARYAAGGAAVTLVTCTAGDEGEVLVPELAHLDSAHDDALGPYRMVELERAMAALGVEDHRWLGGQGRYRDSGMVWRADGRAGPPERLRAGAFWAADLQEAADHLVPVLREARPQVVVTYDDGGGYGHPDHVQAHRVTTYALALAAAPSYRPDLGAPWSVSKVYWTAVPRSVVEAGADRVRAGGAPFRSVPAHELPYGVPDEWVTTAVDGTDRLAAKTAALRAHATQVVVHEPFFALSNEVGQVITGVEHFRLVHGEPGPPDPATGLEGDLFAGVTRP